MIESRQNPQIKALKSLFSSSKKRRESGQFVVEGVRLAEEAFAAGWPIQSAYFASDLSPRGRQLVENISSAGFPVEECAPALLASISDTQSPQGLVLLLKDQALPSPQALSFVLILDSLRDPGNVGSLMRSARAAGVQELWLAPESVDPFAPKVLRSAMGAHFHLPIRSYSWAKIAEVLSSSGLHSFASDLESADNFRNADFNQPLALIIGSEAEGISPEARQLAQHLISIPMQAASESLNAAAAGAILLFEIAHQKGLT